MDTVTLGYEAGRFPVGEVTDTELQGLEADCASEIVDRILRGEWQDFYDQRHDDLTWIVRDALKATDGDVARGVLSIEVGKLAKVYADDYVQRHADVQDLAMDLRVIEMVEA